jgi:hypothetical protein
MKNVTPPSSTLAAYVIKPYFDQLNGPYTFFAKAGNFEIQFDGTAYYNYVWDAATIAYLFCYPVF